MGESTRGEVLAALGPWLDMQRRAAWRPVVPAGTLLPPGPMPDAGGLPASAIVGWDRIDDLPDLEDHASAGLEVTYDSATRIASLRCDVVGLDATIGIDDLPIEDIAEAADGDKLAGWPYWAHITQCPTDHDVVAFGWACS